MSDKATEQMTQNQSGLPGLQANRLAASERVSNTDRVGAGLYTGTVIRVSTVTQSCKVRLLGTQSRTLDCPMPMASGSFAFGFGVSDNRPLVEGTFVLAYQAHPASRDGVILCVFPAASGYMSAGEGELADVPVVPLVDEEAGAMPFTEAVHAAFQGDEPGAMSANQSGRCDGVFPGDYAEYNELGIGILIGRLTAHLRASDCAKVECFLPDDLVRIVAGMFEKYTDLGVERVYNSNGNCTLEFTGSPHQCETDGAYAYDTPTIKETASDGEHARTRNADPVEEDIQPISRFAVYTGSLPGVFQMFVSSPYRAGDVRKYSDKVNDHGLFHAAVDDCGRLTLRSAAEIIIKRTDRIAVPKKLKEPADPSGKRSALHESKAPWKWGDDHPLSKALQLADAEAWWRHNTYRNFIANAATDDWYLENEADLQPIPDDYDTVADSADDYAEGVDKSCEIVLRKDGGMTLRNSEGSEITLAGSKVIISAPGGIEFRTGKSIVALAGNDINLQARHSVDVVAVENDVRIKAENNLHTTSGRSTLIECTATRDDEPSESPDDRGEEWKGTGVVIKASESRVALYGRTVAISALKRIVFDTITNVAGEIVMLAGKLIGSFKNRITLATGVSSGLTLSDRSAQLVAGSVAVTAASSLALSENGRSADVTFSGPGQTFTGATQQLYALAALWDEQGWLDAWHEQAREIWVFTYRTGKDFEDREFKKLSDDDPDFRLYESYWTYLARKSGSAQTWAAARLHDTYPWPGYEKRENDTFYYRLDSEVNLADSVAGVGKTYAERRNTGTELSNAPFSEYAG